MIQRTLRSGPLLVLLVAIGGLAVALVVTAPAGEADLPDLVTARSGTTPVAAATPDSDERAVALLQRAAQAARTQPYAGTQFVSSWGPSGARSVVVDVSHQPGQGSLVRVQPSADVGGTQIFEPDNPASAGESVLGGDLSALDWRALELLREHYDLRLGVPTSCVGRPVDVVEVHRRGDAASTIAGRFWIDAATGLVLRRQVVDQAGRTVRASAFVSLDETEPHMPRERPAAMPAPAGRPLDPAELARLRVGDWTAPATLAGTLNLYDARSIGNGADRVLHLSYSDGLSAVSLFEQRGQLDTDGLSAWRRFRVDQAVVRVGSSVPVRAIWSDSTGKGSVIYTVLSDAPMDTLAAVVSALPHRAPSPSAWSRLHRGLARLGSWVDPFN